MSDVIDKIHAREVLDSRGNPTVEVEMKSGVHVVRAMVPSGASTGEHEAVELRDGGNRFHGKGVLNAVRNVNEIITPQLVGRNPRDQPCIDNLLLELDGTENKSKLGANAILGVSLAVARLHAALDNVPLFQVLGGGTTLPVPLMNVINGGKHAGGKLAIQEFMLVPYGFSSFREALRAGSEIYHSLKAELKKISPSAINVGDEGGFAPPFDKASEALTALVKAIEDAGYNPGKQVGLAIDAAASEFYHDGKYHADGKIMTAEELQGLYEELAKDYPLLIIEDPFDENDFDSFANITKSLGSKISIVADDLTVTNVNRIQTAIEKGSANYLLLKVNQIGTLTESLAASDLVKKHGWGVVVSHRSGETEDSFIADLAVGIKAERIKTGAPARSERVAKYNQLLRIEELLGDKAVFQGTRM